MSTKRPINSISVPYSTSGDLGTVEDGGAPGAAGAMSSTDLARRGANLSECKQQDEPRHSRRHETERAEGVEHERLEHDEQDAHRRGAKRDESEKKHEPRTRPVAPLAADRVEHYRNEVSPRAEYRVGNGQRSRERGVQHSLSTRRAK